MLKRILENQLHLHDEGNPAWGTSGEYGGAYGDREEKDTDRLKKLLQEKISPVNIKRKSEYQEAPKNFADELKEMSDRFVSPKLEKVKDILRISAATGERSKSFKESDLDKFTIKWLESQGLKVESKWSGTVEEGQTYYEISW